MRPALDPDGFPAAFEAAFEKVRFEVEAGCAATGGEWPERVVAGIRQVLAFAAANPEAASVLISGAQEQGAYGFAHYDHLLDYFGEMLKPGRQLAENGAEFPELLEHALAGGIATLVSNRVDSGHAAELPQIAPEAIQFVLTPYLGADEARRLGAQAHI